MRVPDLAGREGGGELLINPLHWEQMIFTEEGSGGEGGKKRLRKIEPYCECTLTCSIQSSVPACTQPSRQR